MTGLLSGALANLAWYNTLAGSFDRIFERCALTPEDVGIAHARSHMCEKSLMPLARAAPSPPFTGSGTSRQVRSWFYVGSYPPQPQTTISNSKYVRPRLCGITRLQLENNPAASRGVPKWDQHFDRTWVWGQAWTLVCTEPFGAGASARIRERGPGRRSRARYPGCSTTRAVRRVRRRSLPAGRTRARTGAGGSRPTSGGGPGPPHALRERAETPRRVALDRARFGERRASLPLCHRISPPSCR